MNICTIATESCKIDLQIFLFTLTLYNPTPITVYILCDTFIKNSLAIQNFKTLTIKLIPDLDRYGKVSRAAFEREPGSNYKTKWEDFMMEKTTVMDKALVEASSVFFMDCDICFLGPLPEIPPSNSLALSPHYIRERDTARFGIYNAGFLWTNDKKVPEQWRLASKTSRYYDQAALEDLVPLHTTYFFPQQTNYGWWRMFQAPEPAEKKQAEWSIFRDKTPTSGIRVDSLPLLSIHTHWLTSDPTTKLFNRFVVKRLSLLTKHKKSVTQFLELLVKDLKIEM